MKKLILLAFVAIAATTSTFAQDGKRKEQLTAEQRADLRVKKMTLDLDLSPAQQKEMRSLLAEQNAKKEKAVESRNAGKASETTPTADERYKRQSGRLDQQIADKAQMKKILTADQFAKWEQTREDRKGKMRDHKSKRDGKRGNGPGNSK